jgi:hypothetical protein
MLDNEINKKIKKNQPYRFEVKTILHDFMIDK